MMPVMKLSFGPLSLFIHGQALWFGNLLARKRVGYLDPVPYTNWAADQGGNSGIESRHCGMSPVDPVNVFPLVLERPIRRFSLQLAGSEKQTNRFLI